MNDRSKPIKSDVDRDILSTLNSQSIALIGQNDGHVSPKWPPAISSDRKLISGWESSDDDDDDGHVSPKWPSPDVPLPGRTVRVQLNCIVIRLNV